MASTGREGRCLPTLVVAGALCQGGKVLITQRPEGKPRAFSWEIPGGKVEPGEAPDEALRRELEEELGIVVDDVHPVSFASDALHVLLLFLCKAWEGEPAGKEGQAISWACLAELEQQKMLALDAEFLSPLRALMMRS